MESGSSPAISICRMASWPMTVWCRQTWFSTLPREYLVLRMRDRVLDGLADGDAEAAGALRVLGQQLAPEFGLVAGAGMDRRAPGVHQHPAIRLVLVADLDHIDVALQAEQLAGQRQRGPHWPAPVSVASRLVPATLLK